MKMCELSLGPQHSQVAVSPSLEDEVLRFLLGEGEPSRVGEATRWYNYHVGMGTGIDALPTASPFFSDAENEQSRVRVQWLLENISIPEKEKFSLRISAPLCHLFFFVFTVLWNRTESIPLRSD